MKPINSYECYDLFRNFKQRKMLVEWTFSGVTESILIILNIVCLEQHEG